MTSQYSNDRSGDRRQGVFIRWSSASRRRGQRDLPDPGFVVDRKRLYKYLDSLEGLSGE
ncbi:hypothetical protein IQ273_20510 [Nodosilinea sp. LEGE 07298]|uniref:hypothetical protein n=1 Tax=Nodosilinea sp. LEGE 07298 TaxID=2777970 RepID=UPI0018823CCF|nr:hypothetical protein [Nodosilinea sp. LEGE 07298]MBE9111793.1 hypothetical protein [Nodosilinea sp. LEGE 07298]